MRTRQSFRSDERAIEGLPIRLVIAVVVGVAALSAMMAIMGDIGDVGKSEVDANVVGGDRVIESSTDLKLRVTDSSGEPVEDATVILKSGTALLSTDPGSKTTDSNGEVTFSGIGPSGVNWRSNQEQGNLKIDIIPPGDGDYKDEEGNTEIVVMNT